MATIPGAAGPGAPFPQWTYNTQSHVVSRVNNAAAKAGAIAVTFPFKLIFFTSEAAATAYATSQGGGVNVSNSPATAAANAVGAAGQAIAGTTGTATAACAVSVPVVGCLLTKTQARALIGGLIIAGSAVAGIIGVMLLAAEGFRSSGAGAALGRTGSTLGKVPGLGGTGAALKSVGARRPAEAAPKAVPGVKPAPKQPAPKGP